jgi:hypothetical protein
MGEKIAVLENEFGEMGRVSFSAADYLGEGKFVVIGRELKKDEPRRYRGTFPDV